ncbi:MAG: ATP-binding cassette domain-containing protein [Phycisphaeraceae bacterium]|nr:ATP-binding cassette domain-containing protein [Phycisphaeraceae bacterium]
MSDIAIEVEDLGKRYRLGASAPYHRLSEAMVGLTTLPFRATRKLFHPPTSPMANTPGTASRGGNATSGASASDLWALRHVSFQLKEGEVLGVIGRNGSGKSTLLKLLSRVTEPTEGHANIRGRVGSLLEVGTGFHPELTGRENIFLNGAILGMTPADIRKRFDEIVAFSELEKFLDTPVKRYSSGMYTRLAFAVAAHLEPDILVVDEVLAVGDLAFQKKCLGKMSEVSRTGRTVLFVSHNMTAVQTLCTSAMLLDAGELICVGKVGTTIGRYRDNMDDQYAVRRWNDDDSAPGDDVVRILSMDAGTDDQSCVSTIEQCTPFHVAMTYRVFQSSCILIPNIHLYTADGVCISTAIDHQSSSIPKQPGVYKTILHIPAPLISPGIIHVNAAMTTFAPWVVHFHITPGISLTIAEDQHGLTNRAGYTGMLPGVVLPNYQWATTPA